MLNHGLISKYMFKSAGTFLVFFVTYSLFSCFLLHSMRDSKIKGTTALLKVTLTVALMRFNLNMLVVVAQVLRLCNLSLLDHPVLQL